jgi:hypothetical protein
MGGHEWEGARPKDLGILDGSREGLILVRRVKAALGSLPHQDTPR